MNKKLLKSMLVVACAIMGGQNVWADTYEILYGVATTSDETITGVTSQTDFTGDANEQTGVTNTDGNGSKCDAAMPIDGSVLYLKNAWTKDFSAPITEGQVYFAGNYTVSANNNQTIKIVDSKGNVIFASTSSATSKNNGTFAIATICGKEITSYVRLPRACHYGIKSICIDLNTRVVTYQLISSSGNNAYSEINGTENLPDDIKDVKGLSIAKTYYGAYLDNVMLYSVKSDAVTCDYTINYKFDSDIVATTIGKCDEGTTLSAQKVVYDDSNNKYFCKAETLPTFTVSKDGENVFNVDVRKAYTATLTLDKKINGEIKSVAQNLIEADDNSTNWSISYPLYEELNGAYYTCDKTTFTEEGSFTDGETINKTVEYPTLVDGVIFFKDGENLGVASSKNASYSSGAVGYIAAQNYTVRGGSVGKLVPGKYQFVANVIANQTRNVALRDKDNTDYGNNIIAEITSLGLKSVDFTLDKTTDLIVNGKNSANADGTVQKSNQSADFDYVYIKAISIPASISAAKFATFIPSYNIVAQSDVKAYTVKVNTEKTGIELNEVAEGTIIPAGTALLLNAAEGSYDFAVSTADASTLADNDLIAATTDVTATGNEYALTKKNGVVGFAPVKADVVIPAGKAYLHVAGEGAKFFSLDGEATGINTIGTTNNAADVYYTLQGVKTLKPAAKGVYILNGKKVIVNK